MRGMTNMHKGLEKVPAVSLLNAYCFVNGNGFWKMLV